MDFTYSNDGFLPYESFEYIYSDRKMPEFGEVRSPYVTTLDSWKFFLAGNDGEVPFGFEAPSFDDSEWNIINTPSVWQCEGYGLPNNLLYNYADKFDGKIDKKDETITDKFLMRSSDGENDEIGIYRTTLVVTAGDLNRALYLETSGIAGCFMLYVNGKHITTSHAILTRKKILLSDFLKEGVNHICIAVKRYDRNSKGHIINDLMNYGMSGIFRPVYIVKESLLELTNLHIKVENVPEAYLTEIANINLPSEKTGAIAKVPHGDFLVKADFAIKNHTDYMMPYEVRISILEAREQYDPYKLPFVKMKDQGGAIKGDVDASTEVREKTEVVCLDIAMWSDATPVQYDLAIELLDSSGNVIVAKKKRFGFRETKIVHNKININDRRINLLGVKYYEFDPKTGITVSIDRMRQDIILMKRCGLNAILCSGYPVSDELLNLCDQYGIYVIATAASRYMRDYIEAAMNHPSVIVWGIQNFNFVQEKAVKCKEECTLIDDTRPWYIAKDKSGTLSDLKPLPGEAGALFGPWMDLCLDRKSIFDKNKIGKNLFETIPGRTKFSDDDADYKWIHHADLVGGKQKEDSAIGQGIVDAERNPHPIYSDIKKQCQMLNIFAAADDATALTLRNTNPFAYTEELELEWKLLLGGQKIMSGKGNISEIEPYGTRNLRFPIDVGRFLTPGWAGDRAEYVELYVKALSHELVFDITLKLANDTYYAGRGFEIANYQDVLAKEIAGPAPDQKGIKPGLNAYNISSLEAGNDAAPVAGLLGSSAETEDTDGKVEKMAENVEELVLEDAIHMPDEAVPEEKIERTLNASAVHADQTGLNVGNKDLSFKFSRKTGSVDGIIVNDFNFLKGGFKPSFYRCPSNIDRTDKSFVLAKTIFSKESDYEAIQESLEYKSCQYTQNNGIFSMISRYRSFAMKDDVILYYEVLSADKLRITLRFTPKYDLVRYGLRVPIVKDEILCSWYGRGPGESYPDRKNATRIGLFAAGADKIYHPYARPAENSSHCDTEVVKISNKQGDGFSVRRVGDSKFDFTVLPFTPEQMNEYLHEEQLMNNDFCELFLDFCSKEIERTKDNISLQPLKKNVTYKETFEITLEKNI